MEECDRFVTSLFGSVLRESADLLTNTISADAVSRTFLADSLFLCIAYLAVCFPL